MSKFITTMRFRLVVKKYDRPDILCTSAINDLKHSCLFITFSNCNFMAHNLPPPMMLVAMTTITWRHWPNMLHYSFVAISLYTVNHKNVTFYFYYNFG